ncbi:unnamed protein product [Urochloa humidicola]
MGIPCVINPSGYVIAATNYHTPFAAGNGKGGHAHGSVALLRKRRNGVMTCTTRGGSSRPYLSLHGEDSAACQAPASSAVDNAVAGIGIAEFFVGKNLLITGGTGFLAKLLIEKILRETPSVGKIYVVIKAKDSEAASKRLQNEVVDTELFKCL